MLILNPVIHLSEAKILKKRMVYRPEIDAQLKEKIQKASKKERMTIKAFLSDLINISIDKWDSA